MRVKPQALQGPPSTEREVWIPLKDSHCRYHRKYFQAELGLQDTVTDSISMDWEQNHRDV